MRELAVQSANDTNVEVDRGEIQKEVDQLAAEITRIADTTQFNTQDLLTGEFKAKFHIGANEGQNVDLAISDMSAEALKVGNVYIADGNDLKAIGADGKATEDVFATWQEAAEASESEGTPATPAGYYKGDELVLAADKALDAGSKVGIGGIDVSEQEAADGAITTINKAIETVSAERSKLGAMQNRLEHTIKNLDTSAENLQAAESRIRDVDMAKEMMEFTKQNILQQAATAMLAQANMAPQSVLKLLG